MEIGAENSLASDLIASGALVIRKPRLLAITGFTESTLDREVRARTFPAPVKLTAHGRAIGWRVSDVVAWLDSLPTKTSIATAPKHDAGRGA
jgi:predicted DNA-binding transcriptional regulator AlpA